MRHRILVVDDEADSRKVLKEILVHWGYEVKEAADGQEALQKSAGFLPAVVIADLVMPGLDGLGLLKVLHTELPFAAVIILTGQATIESAVAAMMEGAYDYVTKPVDPPRLKILIEKAIEKAEALREVFLLRRRLKDVWGVGRLVGKSKAMQEVHQFVELAAPTPASVLITGESGTGKELVARTLHELSPRRNESFIAVNCSAFPETLLESEIFGHERGAFTGAMERRAGCFELAHEGTILLDEIAEMGPGTQAKFLRVLEDGTLRRLGGKSEIKVDVRVLAATNKDPVKAIRDGMLREDLYYRLNVFNIRLPPLRERKEDIPLLIQAFLEELNARYEKRIRSVDQAALQILAEHSWPGNVRELRNTLERAAIACDTELITPAHLPAGLTDEMRGEAKGDFMFPPGITLKETEKQLILRTLASVNNNKTRAAKILGVTEKTLRSKLHRFGV